MRKIELKFLIDTAEELKDRLAEPATPLRKDIREKIRELDQAIFNAVITETYRVQGLYSHGYFFSHMRPEWQEATGIRSADEYRTFFSRWWKDRVDLSEEFAAGDENGALDLAETLSTAACEKMERGIAKCVKAVRQGSYLSDPGFENIFPQHFDLEKIAGMNSRQIKKLTDIFVSSSPQYSMALERFDEDSNVWVSVPNKAE
jgi:hypothetical protein